MDLDGKNPLNERLNPNSWQTFSGFLEPSLQDIFAFERFQFIRKGYFATDYDTKDGNYVFNRIVELKSSFK